MTSTDFAKDSDLKIEAESCHGSNPLVPFILKC